MIERGTIPVTAGVAVAGKFLVPAPLLAQLKLAGVEHPRAELRVIMDVTSRVMNVGYAETQNRKVGLAFLEAIGAAVEQTTRAETRLAQAGSDISKVFPLSIKRSEVPGVVHQVLDHVPSRAELRATLIPLTQNQNLILFMTVAPGALDEKGLREFEKRREEAIKMIPGARVSLTYAATWEALDANHVEIAKNSHKRLMPQMGYEAFLRAHFVFKFPETFAAEHLSRIEGKAGKGMRTLLDNIKVTRDDPRYPVYRLILSTLAAKLAQSVVSRLQQQELFNTAGPRYWAKDSVFETYMNLIVNMESFREAILAAA
jgi:hypothetical protein